MSLNYANLRPVLEQLGDRVTDSLQIVAGSWLAGQHYAQVNPDQPLLVAGLAGRDWVQEVVGPLLAVYPAEHQVLLVTATRMMPVALAALGSAAGWGEQVCLFVPALSRPGSYMALQNVVARLRAPDGCPWDRELTWARLRPFLLEESYELLAALDTEDPRKVAEEQGDLLLQLALQTQIAVEEGKFHSGDIIAGIVEKLIRRHPHVFGDQKVSGTDEVLANWEAIKRAERATNGEPAERRSPLAGIPAGLPALAQAAAYLDRISRLEELATPAAPCAGLLAATGDRDVTSDEVGQALFNLVAWARARGIDAESALRTTNQRYAGQITD